VVLAAAGYPGKVRSGDAIDGLAEDGQLAGEGTDLVVFHAGTKREGERLLTSGGRVLGVTARGRGSQFSASGAPTVVLTVFGGMACTIEKTLAARTNMSGKLGNDVAVLMGSKSDLENHEAGCAGLPQARPQC